MTVSQKAFDIARSYTRNYKGYKIELKQDFGDQPHLIDGVMHAWGWVVTKPGGGNVMPGATWFICAKDACRAIDIFEAVKGNADAAARFWSAMRHLQANEDRAAAAALVDIEQGAF
jgi:hypothetical protein